MIFFKFLIFNMGVFLVTKYKLYEKTLEELYISFVLKIIFEDKKFLTMKLKILIKKEKNKTKRSVLLMCKKILF